jgi:hypothetical protein
MYFDSSFTPPPNSAIGIRHQIPVTPEDTWRINLLDEIPTEKTYSYSAPPSGSDGATATHKYLVMPYQFTTYIITDENSLLRSEPDLNAINATHTDTIIVPRDPDDILQRTGYACMDEAEFPPYTVESAQAWSFWDTSCVVEDPAVVSSLGMYHCHFTVYPNQTCLQVADANVGTMTVNYQYKRVAWDESIASEYRRGTSVMDGLGADLKVAQSRLNVNRIEYRYI